MDKRRMIGNILFGLLMLSMILALGFIRYTDQQERKEQSEIIEALNAKARPYQAEKIQLQLELDGLQRDTAYQSKTARYMVGFLASSADDFSYIREQAQFYGFSPIIIFDCDEDTADLQEQLTMTEDTWEIMLGTSSFGSDVSERIQAFKAWLDEEGRKDTGVFFIRRDDLSAANIQLLLDNGLIGYTEYHDSPSAGQKLNGAVCFDYSYIWTNEVSVDSRLSGVYANRSAMLYVFDMEKMRSGEVTETAVATILRKVQRYAAMEHGTFATVGSVVAELLNINCFVEEKQAAKEERMSEIQGRMDELDKIIHDIYAERTW